MRNLAEAPLCCLIAPHDRNAFVARPRVGGIRPVLILAARVLCLHLGNIWSKPGVVEQLTCCRSIGRLPGEDSLHECDEVRLFCTVDSGNGR